MVVSSTLVNVAEDAEIRLVGLLAGASQNPSFQTECEACIQSGDAARLIQLLLADEDAIAGFLVIESIEEAIGAFSILAALLERIDDAGLCETLVRAVDKAAPTNVETNTVQRKISILSTLFNMRSLPKDKCDILAHLFRLAGLHSTNFLADDQPLGSLLVEEKTTNLIAPTLPRLVSIVDTWNVEMKERRNLYRAVAAALPVGEKRHQRFLLLLVDTYTEASQVDAQALDAAKNAAIGAIRDPVSLFLHQRNLLKQPAVKQLAEDHAVLLGLLQVFQEGKLSDYQAFVQSNGGENVVLGKYGLDAATCQRFMKILSICSLASEHEEIPYSVIAETIQLPSKDQVESWVIAAVSSGLLQAKMDQLTEKVMVERCVVRRFDAEQWKVLQSRLKSWKENVGDILSTLKQSQVAAKTL